MNNTPPLAITAGEPAGIGPDLIIQYAQQPLACPLVVIGDAQMLQQRAQQLALPLSLIDYTGQPITTTAKPQVHVLHTPLEQPCQAGQLEKKNAGYVLRTLQLAVEGCLTRRFSAMVTAPVHKGIINEAGIPFSGHTEYLAKLSGVRRPVMMLATDKLRIALATTHLPLSQVSQAITAELLTETLTILQHDLQTRFALDNPAITVCGLNPHAGEDGHLGREEIDIIAPVIAQLRRQGMNLTGPVPADTAFTPELMQNTAAYLTMYHDQGLPVLKHTGFNRAINITLGLPFVRTSVDHGTALQLAGTGKARMESLVAAIRLAADLTQVSR